MFGHYKLELSLVKYYLHVRATKLWLMIVHPITNFDDVLYIHLQTVILMFLSF